MIVMKIVFLGPPGAGKGTYSSRLSTQLEIAHISTGDIFREEVQQETELGDKVADYLKKGELVPDETTIKVLKRRIQRPDCVGGFILDGYPRTIPQAEALSRITSIDVVFQLKIHEDVLLRKLSARRICKNCGEIYNVATIQETIDGTEYNMPPMLPKRLGTCDNCGDKLIQRKDDNVHIIKERLNIYKNQTQPLIRYYKDKGLLTEIIVQAGPEIMVPKIIMTLEAIITKKNRGIIVNLELEGNHSR
jgi:adenylate kinase